MSAGIVIDESRWPRVYATWPKHQLSDEAFEAMVLAMSAFTARKQPYVVIHDARLVTARPTPKQRAFAATHQELDAEGARRYLRGTALVVPNAVIAGVVRAINWISPPPYPQKIFSSLHDAEAWATAQLAAND